ncbi:MAG: tyrosine--tRNA ligase [Patescibacteria group bacterium]|nr:tyrosine--tRNA ligase [Patescibacteria group bacterium]
MDPIDELLTRGVAEVIVKDELHKKLLSGERLRVKLGIDPTSPDLHIGRAVSLLKLRDFQKLGHQVVLIVGDFTAVIGDTSDKEAERPMLTHEAIEHNMKTYYEQVGGILDLSKVEFRHNSEWLVPLTYRDIGEHADLFSVADFIARDNIARRLKAGKRVSLREVLYPLMQGYDSVAVKADVELGGMDQKFNLLAGRTMQEKMGQRPQDIVMNPLIEGLDGRKMSSSWGNTIALTAPAHDMFGKVMSMADEQVPAYFELCTRVPMNEVKEILKGHPKVAKMRLAHEIVALYHGKDAAQKAEDDWTNTFSEGGVPAADVPTVSAGKLRDIIKDISTSELRRLVEQGAVSSVISGKKIGSIDDEIREDTIRIGKHRFLRVKVR